MCKYKLHFLSMEEEDQQMRSFLKENGLVLTLFALFLIILVAQSIVGLATYNNDQINHGQATINYLSYLTSGEFLESVFENWESEFLQMGAYVWLTAFLIQKGAPESRSLEGEPELDADPRLVRHSKDAPWAVRQGGIILFLYQYSLTIALLLFFVISFSLHAYNGALAYCDNQKYFGKPCVSTLGYLLIPQFWFESFQNWQSEFFSMGVMILFSIFLRHRGSPESKPVASPHDEKEKREKK